MAVGTRSSRLRDEKEAIWLDLPREVLREYGNMSSVSVLFVLERFLEGYPAGSGEHGAISALGPGFSAEHVLFRC